MSNPARSRFKSVITIAVCTLAAGFLAACATSQPKSSSMQHKKRSKEYFAESEYGVKASPRVAYGKTNLPRGGGRDQTGKPYMVRGKMYYPKEVKNYRKTGLASWYGDAFHGRLTANGEVYDMTHLTAAHPTMPLPSYARVTNTANGSSVIVRVNDRGPYSHGRLIDLSKRAADMLDYSHTGTAKVVVEYVGRAPLEGTDDRYLLASYRPGKDAPDLSDGLPAGVMIAMNGRTPSAPVRRAAPEFPGVVIENDGSDVAYDLPSDAPLPSLGPVAPDRPVMELPANSPFAMASMSYAQTPRTSAAAFAALDGGLNWKAPAAASEFVSAGSFRSRGEAEALASALQGIGEARIVSDRVDGTDWFSVSLYPTASASLDDILRAAWAKGATDAVPVRD